MNIHRVERCASTMDEARRLARDGAPDNTTVIAQEMTAGRGRHDHTWHAPEGGLYLTTILRNLDEPHHLTLALGNAVADVLEVAGAQPRLKWVNDVWVEDKKIAGILVEAQSTGERIDFLLAGIGINVNGTAKDFSDGLAHTSTTLEDVLGAENCIEDLETFLLQEMERWIDRVRKGRDQDIVGAWRRRDLLQGKAVRIDNGETVTGTAAGINDDGHLMVDVDGTTHTFDNGTVHPLELRQTP